MRGAAAGGQPVHRALRIDRRRPAWWLGAAVLAGGVILAWQPWRSTGDGMNAGSHPAAPSLFTESDATSGAADGRPVAPASAGNGATEPAAASLAAVDRLWRDGSLRGTVLDGDWGRWSGSRLQPSFSLRQRFDQLLSAQGEVALDDLRRWVAAQVAAAHGTAGAAQVLDVWDRYLRVQTAGYAVQADPVDPTTWQPALADHSRVRRNILGSAWAEAFYGAEERQLAAVAAAATQPAAAPNPAPPPTADAPGSTPAAAAAALLTPAPGSADPAEASRLQAARAAQFGAPAAERLQANDAAWRAWQQRIDAGRSGWAAIEQDPALSPTQRQEAEARLLREQFSPDEQARARGLIAPAAAAESR